MSSDVEPAESVGPETRPRRVLRRRWLVVIVAVLVVASGGVAAWSLRHSDQSFPGGYGMQVRRQVGEPVWTSLIPTGRPGAQQVTITDLSPRIEVDSAEVEVEYIICELDPAILAADEVVGFGYGMHAADVERYCTATRPAEGATFPLRAQPPQELLVGITPTRPGRSVITSHRISFEDGWKSGDDVIGVETHIAARRPG